MLIKVTFLFGWKIIGEKPPFEMPPHMGMVRDNGTCREYLVVPARSGDAASDGRRQIIFSSAKQWLIRSVGSLGGMLFVLLLLLLICCCLLTLSDVSLLMAKRTPCKTATASKTVTNIRLACCALLPMTPNHEQVLTNKMLSPTSLRIIIKNRLLLIYIGYDFVPLPVIIVLPVWRPKVASFHHTLAWIKLGGARIAMDQNYFLVIRGGSN